MRRADAILLTFSAVSNPCADMRDNRAVCGICHKYANERHSQTCPEFYGNSPVHGIKQGTGHPHQQHSPHAKKKAAEQTYPAMQVESRPAVIPPFDSPFPFQIPSRRIFQCRTKQHGQYKNHRRPVTPPVEQDLQHNCAHPVDREPRPRQKSPVDIHFIFPKVKESLPQPSKDRCQKKEPNIVYKVCPDRFFPLLVHSFPFGFPLYRISIQSFFFSILFSSP